MMEYKYKFAEIAELRIAAIDNLKTLNRVKLSVSSDFLRWKGGGF